VAAQAQQPVEVCTEGECVNKSSNLQRHTRKQNVGAAVVGAANSGKNEIEIASELARKRTTAATLGVPHRLCGGLFKRASTREPESDFI